jgi:hypothetical protein
LADPRLAEAGQAPPEDRLRALALYILEERERRRWHFPRAVFDEVPWEMLLLLYASRSGPLSAVSIANGIFAAPDVVDRWIDYLEREGLVERRPGKAALRLTDSGLSSLELYLRDRLQRAGPADEGSIGGARGLYGLRLALLLLATAILSGTMGWALASG